MSKHQHSVRTCVAAAAGACVLLLGGSPHAEPPGPTWEVGARLGATRVGGRYATGGAAFTVDAAYWATHTERTRGGVLLGVGAHNMWTGARWLGVRASTTLLGEVQLPTAAPLSVLGGAGLVFQRIPVCSDLGWCDTYLNAAPEGLVGLRYRKAYWTVGVVGAVQYVRSPMWTGASGTLSVAGTYAF